MRVLTSLFSAGREGTDKGEGVPPRAVCCIWAVCYNVGNGKRAEYIAFRQRRRNGEKKMRMKRTSEQFTVINGGGDIPDNFSGKAEVIYKKNSLHCKL